MSEEIDHSQELRDVTVILTTQWRASALGFAGDPNVRTPHLDLLAERGLWLKQAVTPHPFGVFARAAFLTGKFCPGNGVEDYYDPLPEDAQTLAHAFSRSGYETAFFGKWQLFERDSSAPVVGESHARIVVPESRRGGFDFWEGFESGFLLNDPLLHGTELPAPTRFEGYQSDVIFQRFLRFQEKRDATRPLFTVISLDAPHPPYAAPAAGFDAQPADQIRLLEGTTRDSELRAIARRELAGYYAHIEATDAAIGKCVRTLRERGMWNAHLFAFTSVHGDMHGADGKFRKGWPNEEAIRVPLLLVDGSGKLRRGVDDELLFNLLDLGPTLLGLVAGGQIPPAGWDGENLSGALRNETMGPVQQEISMPSVPPFDKQCPYVWKANRTCEKTEVFPENGPPFSIEHRGDWQFESE